MQYQKHCPECSKEFEHEDNRVVFCSHTCAAKYRNKGKEAKTTSFICEVCHQTIEIPLSKWHGQSKCKDCRDEKYDEALQERRALKRSKRTCKHCGQTPCVSNEICSHFQLFPKMVKFFGMDASAIGTLQIKEAFEKCKEVLQAEIDEGYSTVELDEMHHHGNPGNLHHFLKALGVQVKNLSEGISNAYVTGRASLPTSFQSHYKTGWHTDWQGRKHFFRSSYELDYYLKLDMEKIDYETERLRISYFDTQKNKNRIAIPDVLLVASNEIVEIKSLWTYDEQNMKDKFKAYRELGYTGYVLMNKIERIDF